MKIPRLRSDIPPNLNNETQLACPRCQAKVFKQRVMLHQTSHLATLPCHNNPGQITASPIFLCVVCNSVMSSKKPEKEKLDA